MPRLSLFRPEKGNNYRFIDKQISRMFQAGGTDAYIHKYLGPAIASTGTADQPIYNSVSETNIQDLLLLENRDRKYDPEIYRIRLFYNVKDIDFNLSQFGLFIDQDTLFMTVHINDFINFVGRKPINGDVIELPHLKDDFALSDFDFSLPRYYVIEEVGRASEGFSVTWYPHLYRLRAAKITDSQEFADILKLPAGEGTTLTVGEVMSTRVKELQINDAILNQAESDAPMSGYETRQFYTLSVDSTTGKGVILTAGNTDLGVSNDAYTLGDTVTRPLRAGYTGYLLGDGFPVNGYAFGSGVQFPANPSEDDFFLRTDFLPNRLFRFAGTAWVKIEDSVRMTMSNTDTRHTLKTGFINNNKFTYNEQVATEMKRLTSGNYIINTDISFTSALYVVIKFETETIEFTTSEHINLISSYLVSNMSKVRITLPVVNGVRQTIPHNGVWSITLYNHRDAQKQSLSQALKPQADF